MKNSHANHCLLVYVFNAQHILYRRAYTNTNSTKKHQERRSWIEKHNLITIWAIKLGN